MATLGLDEDELKSLEQLLGKVSQLLSNIRSFRADILKSNPLPQPESLHASAAIVHRNLETILANIQDNADVYARMALHPSTNYPGRAHEGVLTQLLRKKLEPDVEELVAEGRETTAQATPEAVAVLRDIWDELRPWLKERVYEYVTGEANDAYTKEERAMGKEKVRTGLRRSLDDSDDEDEDDGYGDGGAEGMADSTQQQDGGVAGEAKRGEGDVHVGPEPETLLWFAARADFEVPRNVDYMRKRDVKRGLEGVNIPPPRAEGMPPP